MEKYWPPSQDWIGVDLEHAGKIDLPMESQRKSILLTQSISISEALAFYDCGSLGIKNKVLKHYEFTLDDLKKTGFVIIYE